MHKGKQKFAIIGTSCSGKTTLTHTILGKLKRYGILADGVLSHDRSFTFDRSKLGQMIEAQYWMITNLISKENEFLLRDDVEVLVSDRSVLDYYAYMVVSHKFEPGSQPLMLDAMTGLVRYWLNTYDALFYRHPLTFQDDGLRPSNEFRWEVDAKLKELIRKECPDKVHMDFDEESVLSSILSLSGRRLDENELCLIPGILNQDVLIGGSYAFNRQTRHSDVDVYCYELNPVGPNDAKEEKLRRIFGIDVDVTDVSHAVYEYLKTQGFVEYRLNPEGKC